MTLLSNSGGDERGKISGGEAGDQTGKEWAIINWYNRPWDCVLRHPDPVVRSKIAELAKAAAINDKIGYDQHQRTTYWDQLVKNNYDPSKITINCEADCSAGVIANVKAVGYILGLDKLKNLSSTYTGNMRSGFKAAGFECLTDKKYLTSGDYLIPGDILLNDVHHTSTVIDNGSTISTIKKTGSIKASVPAYSFDKKLAGTYTIAVDKSFIFDSPDGSKKLTVIEKGSKVINYGFYTAKKNVKWLYIETFIDGISYTGFCSEQDLNKV